MNDLTKTNKAYTTKVNALLIIDSKAFIPWN